MRGSRLESRKRGTKASHRATEMETTDVNEFRHRPAGLGAPVLLVVHTDLDFPPPQRSTRRALPSYLAHNLLQDVNDQPCRPQ